MRLTKGNTGISIDVQKMEEIQNNYDGHTSRSEYLSSIMERSIWYRAKKTGRMSKGNIEKIHKKTKVNIQI